MGGKKLSNINIVYLFFTNRGGVISLIEEFTQNTMKISCITFLLSILLTSCIRQQEQYSQPQQTATEPVKTEDTDQTVYNVADLIYLYEFPSDTSNKVLHARLTELYGEPKYIDINESYKVKVDEVSGEWRKIHVEYPFMTKEVRKIYTGWVKADMLINPDSVPPIDLKEGIDYTLLKEVKLGNVYNYYYHYKGKDLSRYNLARVAEFFGARHHEIENVYIFDTGDLGNLIDKYPLSKTEYLKVADHLVYQLDHSRIYSYYPYQDIRYAEYGGKNWKKEPIQVKK